MVAHELAATAGESERTLDRARLILLAWCWRRVASRAGCLGHAAKDRGAALPSPAGQGSSRPKQVSVLSGTGDGKVFKEWVKRSQLLTLKFCCGRRKTSELKNVAGALHADGFQALATTSSGFAF